MMISIGLVLMGLTLVCGGTLYNIDQNNQHSIYAPAYTVPAAGPSNKQDNDDSKQTVEYKYDVNDNYGNEYSKKEHIDENGISGEYHVLLPDGRRESVTYESGAYGHLAQIDIVQTSGTAPASSAPPSYSGPSLSYSAPPYSAPAFSASYSVPTYSSPSYSVPAYSAPSYSAPTYNIYTPTVTPYVYQEFHQRMVPIGRYAAAYSSPSYLAPTH